MENSEKQRIQELIARHFDGGLDKAGAQELSVLLRKEEWVRDEFLKAGEVHGRLMWEFGKLTEVAREHRHGLWVRSATALALAAALVGLLVVGKFFLQDTDRPQAAQAVIPAKNLVLAVARVIQQEQAAWGSHENQEVKTGEWLLPETYQLQTGKITLAFDGGSTMQVQAPASFTLINAQSVQLQRGRLQARVIESAKGFTVLTPEGKVIDLGTEFYVDVASNGRTDVGVIEGLVETVTPQGDVHQLKAQQKLILANGKQTQLRLKDAPKLDSEYRFSGVADYYHWGFDQQEESPDPTTGEPKRVYAETGTNIQSGRLPLREAASREQATSPRLVQGVFGQAIEFVGDGGFLVSSYSGVSGSNPRTVAAWVRIPSNAPPETAYGWAGWGTHAPYDKAHKWQMCWNPQFKLPKWKQPLSPDAVQGAIRTEFGPGWIIGKTDLRDGQWHHVVSIFIGGNEADVATHVRHYVDGRLEEISGYQSQKIDTWTDKPQSWPLVVGHHLDIPGDYFTGFKGAIDELYVFEGALTPAQVWQLYKENKPPAPGTIPPSLGTIAKTEAQ